MNNLIYRKKVDLIDTSTGIEEEENLLNHFK